MDKAPKQERLNRVDTARGIGIILVVFGHALRGHVSSGACDPAWHADMQDTVIYLFHMPLFFFLAALRLAQHAIGFSNNPIALILGTLIGIAGPLAVWTVARRYRLLPLLGLGAQPRIGQERGA